MAALPVSAAKARSRWMAVGRMAPSRSSATRCTCRPSNQATAELEVPKSSPMPMRAAMPPPAIVVFPSAPEVGAAHAGIGAQRRRGLVQDHLPGLQHEAFAGNLQCQVGVLLHQQDGDAALAIDLR